MIVATGNSRSAGFLVVVVLSDRTAKMQYQDNIATGLLAVSCELHWSSQCRMTAWCLDF